MPINNNGILGSFNIYLKNINKIKIKKKYETLIFLVY